MLDVQAAAFPNNSIMAVLAMNTSFGQAPARENTCKGREPALTSSRRASSKAARINCRMFSGASPARQTTQLSM